MNLDNIIIITISICLFLIIGIILFLISNNKRKKKTIFHSKKYDYNLDVETQYTIIKKQKHIIINLKIKIFYLKCLYYLNRLLKCH